MSSKNITNIKNAYTVEDFCKKYKETNVEQTKQLLVKNVMNQHYIPYETKIAVCENIVKNSYYKKRKDSEFKRLYINSPAKYMLYCLNLVKHYTNINIDFSKALKEFNLLNECGLLDVIYKFIPEKELKEFNIILDMVENDVMQNEYEIRAFISNQVETFGELIGTIAKPALDRLSHVIENIDEENIEKTIDKFNKLSVFDELKKKFNIEK